MRTAFIKTLTELAKKDRSIYLLTGDLGFSVFEEFEQKFPERFINCGVAEQNMIGVAAGLALSGKKVVVYSIIPFVTIRCFEQIRNDVCLQNLNVKIVGVGGGLSYGALGATHHAIEDLAIMRSLPNIIVLCPADPIEAELAVKAVLKFKGPAYLRLGKSKEENIHLKPFKFQIGKANFIKNGKDITIIGIGPILKNAVLAAETLKKQYNISIRIISMPTLKPLDKNIVLKAAKETKAIFTIEEHSLVGGLGSAVAEILAESKNKILFRRIALPDKFCKEVGNQEYLREKNGLSVEAIKKAIKKIWKSKINIA